MIDDKEIKTEKSIIEETFNKIGKVSKSLVVTVFDFLRKTLGKEPSMIYLVSDEELISDTILIIEDLLSRNNRGLIVTFDLRTRDLAEKLKSKGIDIEKRLYFLDCISYYSGKGAPPVFNLFCMNKPDDFENIYYYSLIHLKKMNVSTSFVVMIAPNVLLKYSDYNEIGIFFNWFFDKMREQEVSPIIIYPKKGDPILMRILARLVEREEDITIPDTS